MASLLYVQFKGASFPLPFDKADYENVVNVHLLQRIHAPRKEETHEKASATELGLLLGVGKDREESYLKTECIILFIDTDRVRFWKSEVTGRTIRLFGSVIVAEASML